MKVTLLSILLILSLSFFACESNIVEPGFGSQESVDSQRLGFLKDLSGAYRVEEGSQLLGDTVFIRAIPPSVSIITGLNARVAILSCNIIGDSLRIEGKMRNSDNTELFFLRFDTGLISQDSSAFLDSTITGSLGSSTELINKKFTLKLIRKIDFGNNPFYIIGHRGGGSNGTSFPVPENSLAILSMAELYGANSVEIDVQLTKDKVPIVYHDLTLNKRLLNSEFLTGNVSDTYFKHLREFGRLKNGEKIPTLRETLNHILYKTSIKAVWLDVKNAELIDSAIAIQLEFLKQKPINRGPLEIYIGLAYEETYQKYMINPLRSQSAALCELSVDHVDSANAEIWAPRWTLGPMTTDIDKMHAKGKKVFFWTVDEIEMIREIVEKTQADGILSNFPQEVLYEKFKMDLP